MTKNEAKQIKIGDTLVYNDGRTGHTSATCEVISVIDSAMVVQFSDRADTNCISFSDSGWMNYLTLCAS